MLKICIKKGVRIRETVFSFDYLGYIYIYRHIKEFKYILSIILGKEVIFVISCRDLKLELTFFSSPLNESKSLFFSLAFCSKGTPRAPDSYRELLPDPRRSKLSIFPLCNFSWYWQNLSRNSVYSSTKTWSLRRLMLGYCLLGVVAGIMAATTLHISWAVWWTVCGLDTYCKTSILE